MISTEIIKDVLNRIGIDFLCVAAHYSDRYGNSDNYLATKVEEPIRKYAMFFPLNNIDKIVGDFIGQCIEPVTTCSTVIKDTIDSTVEQIPANTLHSNSLSNLSNLTWKNMHYIWKLYLSNINIPNMIYSQQLQDILITRITNKNEGGTRRATDS